MATTVSAATIINLCNGALIAMEESSLAYTANLDSPASKKETILADRFHRAIKKVLRLHAWNSVTQRDSLSQDATAPEFEFDYSYSLPSGCMRINEIWLDSYKWSSISGNVWRKENGKILTNAATVDITFNYYPTFTTFANPESANTWNTYFYAVNEDVLAVFEKSLALECCMAITGSLELKNSLMRDYQASLLEAQTADSNEYTESYNVYPSGLIIASGIYNG